MRHTHNDTCEIYPATKKKAGPPFQTAWGPRAEEAERQGPCVLFDVVSKEAHPRSRVAVGG